MAEPTSPTATPSGLDVIVVGQAPGPDLSRTLAAAGASTVLHAPPRAAALNQALGQVTEELVLLVDAGASPDPDGIRAAIDRLRPDGGLSALALAPAPAVSILGVPVGPPLPRRAGEEVLHAPLGATLARAAHLRAVGAFATRMDGGGLDVDLGWRLWLAGGAVRAFPVPMGSPPERPGPGAPSATEVAAALARLALCLEEDRRAVLLPVATKVLDTLAGPVAGPAGVARHEASRGALDAERAPIQQGRRRRDVELLPLFAGPAATAAACGPAADALGGAEVDGLFGPRRRVLIVTADVFTPRMAGPAIRVWQMARVLAPHHVVHVVTLSGICELQGEGFTVEAAGEGRLAELEAWCDVVVVQGYALQGSPSLRATTKVVVADVYDPLHFETLELSRRDSAGGRRAQVGNAVEVLNEQLARADFVICASEKQRDLYIGQLSALGRVNPVSYDVDSTLRALIDVVPFGLPDEPAGHEHPAIKGVFPGIDEGDEVILWGGGIYNWFDPLTLIRAVDRLRRRRPRVRLFFLGVRHPNPGVNPLMRTAAEARALSDRLGLTDTHVWFNDSWVGYDDRQNYLTEADVGVSTHHDHAETAYSFRTRILDYLWAGLPIVATEGDGFAELIAAEGLGTTVPADDVGALEEALFELLDDRARRAACKEAIGRVSATFRWSETLRPLVAFCASPRRAADLVGMDRALADLPAPVVAPAPVPGPAPGPWAGRARIAVALYREGGLRRVAQGGATRARRLAGRLRAEARG